MAGRNWSPLSDIADGQVVDFEILNSLINNTNYLKEHAVSVRSRVGGIDNNENSSQYKMKIVGGKLGFDIKKKTSGTVTIDYENSLTPPIVLVTIADAPTATVSISGVTTSKCTATIYKGSDSGSSKGSLYYLAIITVKQS